SNALLSYFKKPPSRVVAYGLPAGLVPFLTVAGFVLVCFAPKTLGSFNQGDDLYASSGMAVQWGGFTEAS
ncbi:TPA: hypothetical protein DEQ95_00005, partial [Candidatus Beckwithbacteria bacterium]|nr:hypothetical protein [Candidatus Beckwithbacteria bacterium]